MKKIIPFIKAKTEPQQVVPLQSMGPKNTQDGKILDHGDMGDLKYEVYARGVIHIFGQDSLRFKKDLNAFDVEVRQKDFEKLAQGNSYSIFGSGDNDDLIFTKNSSGDIIISLKKKEFEAITLLKSLIKKSQDLVKKGS